MSGQILSSILLTRALSALAIITAGVVIYWLLNRLILYRAQNNGAPDAVEPFFTRQGVPSILYFTTPECVTCKSIQRPALQRLKDRLGDGLQVVEINAEERPDLASRWGVLSVPTTFIIDEQGRLRHVNHGAARAEKLFQQLERIHSEAS
jgi:thiol-disulfide isomerase/thioredoxin